MTPRLTTTAPALHPSAGPFAAFDPATFVAQQRLTAEAMIAAGQKLVEGMQEVVTRSIQLQVALSQQLLAGAARMSLHPLGSRDSDRGPDNFSAISEATVAAIHQVIAASCKCPMDAISAFQRRIGLEPGKKQAISSVCGQSPKSQRER